MYTEFARAIGGGKGNQPDFATVVIALYPTNRQHVLVVAKGPEFPVSLVLSVLAKACEL